LKQFVEENLRSYNIMGLVDENYDKVLDLYLSLGEDDYIERFKRNAHLLKPFRQEQPFKGSNY